ncbi:MAG: molybdenum cofactor guanylyltransferase [Oscillospiraceae bacterium]|nr:molybdenum cofactor guanylyltransferase [Oscillospiraceae bacterium]
MAISPKECGAVILAGGGSRRMGMCKALLYVDGQTMLERTRAVLSDFDEIILSANDPALEGDFIRVEDRRPDSGPLAGLHAALSRTEKSALLCVPCDLPKLSRAVPSLLLQAMPDEVEVLICQDGTGRLHPLCGIYRTTVLPVLERCLSQGRYKVMDFITQLPYACVDTGRTVPNEVFFNMNTPEDYGRAAPQSR